MSDLTVNKKGGGERVGVLGGPLLLLVAVTLPRLKVIESGASLPAMGPVEVQGLILNKEKPNGQKTLLQSEVKGF